MKIYLSKGEIKPLAVKQNLRRARRQVQLAIKQGAEMIVFPSAFLSGPQTGLLAGARYFAKSYNEGALALSGQFPDIYILADRYEGGFVNTVYHGGKASDGAAFEAGGLKFVSFSDENLLEKRAADITADVLILNRSRPVIAGKRALLHRLLSAVHMCADVSVLCCLGGWPLTSHPYVYMPAIGCISAERDLFTGSLKEFFDSENCFDISRSAGRRRPVFRFPSLDFPIVFGRNPLIPSCCDEQEYCLDLFGLQTTALACRLYNLGLKKAVVAVSGGLDSALALLVTANAFDMLGLDRAGIIALSMPGFGTSSTTRSLGRQLAAGLGIQLRYIDITAACTQALKDIGHDGTTADVTFENVQARMRTVNALNIANSRGAIMVGTGDLSEEALGFATYGGDRLASYNVNSSISKTVMRTMLPYVTALDNLKGAKEAVEGILSIPVSPELVPGGGSIAQKTEEILAPYKLIDFFIYCFVIAGMSPIEAAQRASCVFEGEFSASYLREKAAMFAKRFIGGQFKRSCSPEGAVLTHAALYGESRSLPSDSSAELFLSYLDM